MYVFCAGMYRSASTWQYNVVCHLIETFGVGRRIGYYTETEGERFREHYAQHSLQTEFLVLKSHHRHPEFATALTEGRALGVYIDRDLRDVAFSLAHKFNTTFEQVVREKRLIHHSVENDKFWRSQPRMLFQQYHRVVEDPIAAILEIAKHLGLPVSSGLAQSVASQYSFNSNVARTEAIAQRLASQGMQLSDPQYSLSYDEHTLLGWNHMRQGRQGGWRDEATQDQLVTLLAACGTWLILRGYEPDCSWAWKGQAPIDAEAQGAGWTLRGLLEWCEGDGRQIMRLQEEVAQLTHKFHEVTDRFREVSIRVDELEQLSPLIRKQAVRLQAMFTKYPRTRALLKSLLLRQGSAARERRYSSTREPS